MVNTAFFQNFSQYMQQSLGQLMAGPPAVQHGGLMQDHNKGMKSALATQFVPFYKETYQATEFLFGTVPLRSPTFPLLYFQVPVLDVKGDNIPGIGNFAACVRAPIPETIVTPMVGLTNRYLPMNVLTDQGLSPKDVFKQKVNWTPLLEALNNDKAALKANNGKYVDATMGKFKVSVDMGNPAGLTQLAPYRGFTIITAQRVPSLKASVNKPAFNWEEPVEQFQTIGMHLLQHPQAGEDIGQQFVTPSNSSMMDLIFQHLDAASPAAAPAPIAPSHAAPAPQPPVISAVAQGSSQAATPSFPCPTCGGEVRQGFKFCPRCKQELVWE